MPGLPCLPVMKIGTLLPAASPSPALLSFLGSVIDWESSLATPLMTAATPAQPMKRTSPVVSFSGWLQEMLQDAFCISGATWVLSHF